MRGWGEGRVRSAGRSPAEELGLVVGWQVDGPFCGRRAEVGQDG